MTAIFEKMVEDFRRKDTGQLLDICMHPDVSTMKKIPLRYRLIAYGFVRHLSLDELENKLTENGCEKLYARNTVEASLIYAFSRKMSYDEWKKLEQKSETVTEGTAEKWFCGSSVSYAELEQYVQDYSETVTGEYRTAHITQSLKRGICSSRTEEEFLHFMEQNRQDFSEVREKARYYFCKYLKFYIDEKTEEYMIARKTGFGLEQAAMELNILKCSAMLRKKFKDEEELRRKLKECNISFGNLYDAFNYFYFGYISMDWLEILLEYYGSSIEKLSSRQKKKLAEGIRAYENGWQELSDEEVVRQKLKAEEEKERRIDAEYALSNIENSSANRGYQKNRAGEKSVRNYIRGVTDLDRTTLICYMLFLGQKFTGHREWEMSRERLDRILEECGYPVLRERDDFDHFLIQYFMADDRTDFLMESVTRSAMEEKNFYLYHMYQGAGSEDKKLRNLL